MKDVMNQTEVGHVLLVHPGTIRRWEKIGLFPKPDRPGPKGPLFSRDLLDAFLRRTTMPVCPCYNGGACVPRPARRPPVPRDRRHDPFLKAIDTDPLDGAPRLIYADWLEENGFEKQAQEQRLRGAILSDPYNPALRSEYAHWLSQHGRESEARQEAWFVRVFTGERVGPYEVYTRRTVPEKGYWKRRLGELFEAHPEILVIVVSWDYLANQGFRHDLGRWKYEPKIRTRTRIRFKSPILYYRKATGSHGSGVSGAWVT